MLVAIARTAVRHIWPGEISRHSEGNRGRVLLALDAFEKKTQKTPPQKIATAKKRLHSWRQR